MFVRLYFRKSITTYAFALVGMFWLWILGSLNKGEPSFPPQLAFALLLLSMLYFRKSEAAFVMRFIQKRQGHLIVPAIQLLLPEILSSLLIPLPLLLSHQPLHSALTTTPFFLILGTSWSLAVCCLLLEARGAHNVSQFVYFSFALYILASATHMNMILPAFFTAGGLVILLHVVDDPWPLLTSLDFLLSRQSYLTEMRLYGYSFPLMMAAFAGLMLALMKMQHITLRAATPGQFSAALSKVVFLGNLYYPFSRNAGFLQSLKSTPHLISAQSKFILFMILSEALGVALVWSFSGIPVRYLPVAGLIVLAGNTIPLVLGSVYPIWCGLMDARGSHRSHFFLLLIAIMIPFSLVSPSRGQVFLYGPAFTIYLLLGCIGALASLLYRRSRASIFVREPGPK